MEEDNSLENGIVDVGSTYADLSHFRELNFYVTFIWYRNFVENQWSTIWLSFETIG